METSGVNSKKNVLLITGLSISLAIGFMIWYLASKAEETTAVSSDQNTGGNKNIVDSGDLNQEENTNSNQEEEDTNLNQDEYYISYQEEQNIVFTPKEGNSHFKVFSNVFDEVFINNPNYIYCDDTKGENKSGLTEEGRKVYDKIRKGLVPVLHAINYRTIFNHPIKMKGSNWILLSSNNKVIQTFKINDVTTTEEVAENMCRAILKDENIVKYLVISHKNIMKEVIINLSDFTFDALPKVFGVFKKLKMVILDNTGISDLQPLNDAKTIRSISARGNKIRKIYGLERVERLNRLDLRENPIDDIADDFLSKHKGLVNKYDSGMWLRRPYNDTTFKFTDKIQDMVNRSNGKIEIKDDDWLAPFEKDMSLLHE